VAYRSSTYLTGASSATAAVAVPAGAASGDIAVVGIYTESTGAITPPAGFTQKVDLRTGTPSAVGGLVVFWKRLTAADSGTYSFSIATPTQWREAACGLFSGRVASGDPFDLTSTNETTGAGNITATAISPAASGDDLIGLATNFTGGAWTPASGLTERQDTGADATLDTADNVASGTTGNKTFTCAGGSAGMKAFLGALLPVSSSNFTQTNTDLSGPTEVLAQVAASIRAVIDTSGAVDAPVQALAATRAVIDLSGATDSPAQALAASQQPTDPSGATDVLAQAQIAARAIIDASGATDSMSQSYTPGGGTAYRLWPGGMGAAGAPGSDAGDNGSYTMGMEFVLSQAATLTGVYWWRATSTSGFPSQVGFYDVLSQTLLAAPEAFPNPGATTGEIKVTLATPIPVAAGVYKVVVFANPGVAWYSATGAYWLTGPGSGGITAGIIHAPDNPSSDDGQDTFNTATSIAYPGSTFNSANYWVDLEATTSGGTDYVQSFTDGSGAVDAASQVSSAARALTDLAGAVDPLTQAISVGRSMTDSAGAVDLLSSASAFVQSPVDGSGATDPAAQAAAAVRALTDIGGATDPFVASQGWTRTLGDDSGATDQDQTYAAAYSETETDTSGATDPFSQAGSGAISQSFTDTSGASDALTQSLSAGRSVTDSGGATDAVTQAEAVSRSIVDSSGSVDAVSQQTSGAGSQNITDSSGATDGVTQSVMYNITITDSSGAVDSLSKAYSRQLTDLASSTDNASATSSVVVALTDGSGSTDSLSQGGTNFFAQTITDLSGSGDALFISYNPGGGGIELSRVDLGLERWETQFGRQRWKIRLGVKSMKQDTHELIGLEIDVPKLTEIVNVQYIVGPVDAVPASPTWQSAVVDADGDWFAWLGPFASEGTWYVNTLITSSVGEQAVKLAGYVQVVA
jgi:hypothetical protein